MPEHAVCYGQSVTSAEVQQQNTALVQIGVGGGGILPSQAPPGLTVTANVSIKVGRTRKSPEGALLPGGNKNHHPCLPPLTVCNSRVEESPTPLDKAGSGALAVRRGEACI